MWSLLKKYMIIVIPAIMAAGVVWILLFNQSPTVNLPFEKIVIDPESLREVFFETGGGNGNAFDIGKGQWALQYSVDITEPKQICESVFIRKQLFQEGQPNPIADNGVVSTPKTAVNRVDHTMLLPGRLEVGRYTLSVAFTCQVDEHAAVPAVAPPTCFRVTKVESPTAITGEIRLEESLCLKN
jgi:hypothetical protein